MHHGNNKHTIFSELQINKDLTCIVINVHLISDRRTLDIELRNRNDDRIQQLNQTLEIINK